MQAGFLHRDHPREQQRRSIVQLLADRFAIDNEGRAIDVATGEPVTITVGSAGGCRRGANPLGGAMRWMAEVASPRDRAADRLRHRRRFVAFRGVAVRVARWRGNSRTRRAVGGARRCVLRAPAACRPVISTPTLDACAGQTAARCGYPTSDTGYPDDGDAETGRRDRAPVGERLARHRSIGRSRRSGRDVRAPAGWRPRIAALSGPRGSGKALAIRQLARMARLGGLVPVSSRLITSSLAALWRGRSLFVIDTGAGPESAWPSLLQAAVRAPRPHVMLVVGRRRRAVESTAWGWIAVAAESLVAALLPAIDEPAARTRRGPSGGTIARGLPGRFRAPAIGVDGSRSPGGGVARCSTALLAGGGATGRVRRRRGGRRRRWTRSEPPARASVDAERAWPAAGELATWRRRVLSAAEQISGGRHTPGIRLLRQAVGGLARRDAWTDAARGTIALASALLARGRTRDAQAAIEDARDVCWTWRIEPCAARHRRPERRGLD